MTDQGTEYATFIQNELKHEYDRRDSVNSRAATAVTAASGLATLVIAVLAVAKGKDYVLSGAALIALIAGLVALLVAAAFAVLASINWKYDVTSGETMTAMLREHWTDTEVTARNLTAYCNLCTTNSLRRGTNIKSTLLLCAVIAQILAIVALATTTVIAVR